MIIICLLIAAILLFTVMITIDKVGLRTILSFICVAVILVSMFFMVKNDREHFGMHQVSTVKTSKLYSAASSSQLKMLLYQQVGTSGKEKVYIYKTSAAQKKVTTTNPDPRNTHSKVVKVSGTAEVVTKTMRWEYKNSFYSFWFGISGNAHQLVRHYKTFRINNAWLVLSTTQAKKLAQLVKQNQSKMKEAGKTFVTAQVKLALTAALTKNPTMSQAQQQALTKKVAAQAQAQFQQQALAKLIAEVKK